MNWKARRTKQIIWSVSIAMLAIAIVLNIWAISKFTQTTSAPIASPLPTVTIIADPEPIAVPSPDSKLTAEELAATKDTTRKLGHFRYAEADPRQLVMIGSYGTGKNQRFESMQPEAALALMKMIYGAREEGIWLVPVSAYRSVELQSQLFKSQVERRGSEAEAAKVSAPPGYSEHHTGYAVDITDGNLSPDQDVTEVFANTRAYEWMLENAKKFGFEQSFPENNPQGVSFEPWHWRYIASDRAKAIFSRARALTTSAQ